MKSQVELCEPLASELGERQGLSLCAGTLQGPACPPRWLGCNQAVAPASCPGRLYGISG